MASKNRQSTKRVAEESTVKKVEDTVSATSAATEKTTKAPTATTEKEVKKTQTATKPKSKVLSFEDTVAKLKTDGNDTERMVIREMEKYIAKMSPGHIVDNMHKDVLQASLWFVIRDVMSVEDTKQFTSGWKLLLSYFAKEHKGALGEDYVFRFASIWSRSKGELDAFHRCLGLILATADPKSRATGLKQVDLTRVTDFSDARVNANCKRNIVMFYS